MSGQAYQGCGQRTFRQALISMLEKDYRLLGSRRVLALLADDIESMVSEFYPQPRHLSSGWLVFTATRASEVKTRPGFEAGEHELTTLSWPLITSEDIQTLCQLPTGKAGRKAKEELFKRRLLRLVEHGLEALQGAVLLTLADLSLMTGLSTVQVSHYLAELRKETGKALPTKGYHFDQGRRPTHKRQVIELYESGLDEAAIARRTSHSQTSVGHYIRDYERVKLLLSHHTPPQQIATLAMLQPSVVRVYVELVTKYHPHLALDGTGES
jgi:hypothetical protein